MLSSFSKFIHYPRLSLSVIKQQHLFASSSKGDSTSPSTGDTHENGKKDIHNPTIDSSHQFGTRNEKERAELEKEEQGLFSTTQTRHERQTPEQKERAALEKKEHGLPSNTQGR
jgi:hypothetical protein